MSPLDALKVIDRLEIGPLKLQKKRLISKYTLIKDNKEDDFELIFNYKDEVFNPNEHDSQNLGAMIAAQAALNYGLFCKEIVFHDFFDKYDRRFLKDMAENTAREIFINKFLRPNPFILGNAAKLPPLKLDYYLQSEIYFSSDLYNKKKINIQPWPVNYSHYAVLSSGGKDSLLTYGVLKELGYNNHSIFINESGRHWYTAINAYRYFIKNEPNTSRVWTNVDRLFNWMLRHLPFVRKDYSTIRSDEYPIRLWTMAVFIFASLPILKKKGAGCLAIGNEFDTTRRLLLKKIPHYDGLYDQSRFFDNLLTRYFHKKIWGINQFSIIRSLSELLIEKILSQRYPHLLAVQMSCHAAHIENNIAHPCGKCEKCRRIMGMLCAINIDPSICGYTQKQIKYNLNTIAEKGLNQESAAIQQLFYLLKKTGTTTISEPKKNNSIKEKPELMKIRIDSEHSVVDEIPIDLRKPLFSLYLEHTDGAVYRNGRLWIDFDLLNDIMLSRPYPFESTNNKSKSVKSFDHNLSCNILSSMDRKRSYMLGDLSWPEAKERFSEVDIALLPVGSLEQHGTHLPLDTDAFDAQYLAQKVAMACSNPKPLVFPLIPYGVSYQHDDFPGTISINNETLSKLVYDIGINAARNGITKLVIINGHGGNTAALQFAAQTINRDAHIFTCVDTGETSDTDLAKLTETPNDVHAGEIETSTALATRPHLVETDNIKKFIPKFSSNYLNYGSKRKVEWNVRTAKISPSGVLGDPTKASCEKGQKIWEIMIKNLVELVESLKGMSLNGIYEKY